MVIPAYNCAEYLEEAILSIVEQDIGFQEHIQLVLVNDGSTDDTPAICERYALLFPDNIAYIDQANGGVSAARWAGFQLARGTYVNFLDADDMWSLDAFSCARAFFAKHADVSVVTARHRYFGAQGGKHPLDYKYAKTRVIDLRVEHDCPQLAINDAFIRKDLIVKDLFNSRLKVSEDFLAMNLILFDEMRYGVMSQPVYWYRKRADGTSAIDTSSENLSWYFDTTRLCYRRLFDESLVRFGCVLPHIQFSVMYDMQWRIKVRKPHPLTAEQLAEYRGIIVDLLQDIDDDIILAQRNTNRYQRMLILALKYGTDVRAMQDELYIQGDDVRWRRPGAQVHPCIAKVAWETEVTLQFIRREGQSLVLEGRIPTIIPTHKLGLELEGNTETIHARIEPRPNKRHDSFFVNEYYVESGFAAVVP